MAILTYEDILSCSGLPLSIDTETTGLSFSKNSIIGVGIHCPKANVSGYVHLCSYEDVPYGKPKKKKVWRGAMDYSKSKRGKRIFEEEFEQGTAKEAKPLLVRVNHFLAAVQKIAKNPQTTLIGHNLKFDAHFLGLHLWELPCKILDTSVLVHLIDCRLRKSLAAAEDYFLGSQSKRHHISLADKRFAKSAWMWGEQVLEDYCTNDCLVTYQLAETLMPKIREMDLSGLLSLQMKYLRLLQKIEWRGIKVENSFCEAAIAEFEKNLVGLEKDLYDTVGYDFDWKSSQQMSEAIYTNLAIEKPKNPFVDLFGNPRDDIPAARIYTKTGTGTPLLVKHDHPLKITILDLRETAKLKKEAEKYLTEQDSNGIIHSSFNITGTVTGRISSSQPNLQQLAAKFRKYDLDSAYTGGSERVGGYNLRKALIARPGYKILSIDHKQQEARLLAVLSEEPTMLEFMANRQDIHLAIAIRIWGDQGKEINKMHREWSKQTVFALCYGMQEESLREHFAKHGIDADAVEVRTQFFATFPKLQPWFARISAQVERDGYIRYWSGRYWFPDFPSQAYKGVNAIIQGGAGDFLSLVLIRANQVLEAQGWGYAISIIHDEILLEIQEKFLSEAAPVLAKVIEGESVFGVPFLVDVEMGDSYGTLEPYSMPDNYVAINWEDYLCQSVSTPL